MPKKKSLTKTRSSKPPVAYPVPEPPRMIRLSAPDTKLIHLYAARAATEPYEFLMMACRQADAANLSRAAAAEERTRHRSAPASGSSSSPAPNPPKTDEKPF